VIFRGAAQAGRGPLGVAPLGAVPPPVLERVAAVARGALRFEPLPPLPPLDPAPFLDVARRQYRADLVLARLKESAPPGGRILAVAAVDLFLPVLTYVFGCAELRGAAAVVSTHRLDPRFHGEPEDAGLLLERLEKETLHELGHLLGLVHCADRSCLMASAHDVGEIDVEEPSFCADCRAKLRARA